MINVLLIAHCYLVRCELSKWINADKQLCLAEAVSEWKEAKSQIEMELFEVIILDISLSRDNNLEILSDLKNLRHQLPILITSGGLDPEYAINFLKLGCDGYLTKHCTCKQVVEAIYAIKLAGTFVISPSFKHVVEGMFVRYKAFQGLSLREIQILLKLAHGQSIKHISRELNITPSTVSAFKSNIMRKMSFKNSVDLIHYSMDHQLVDIWSKHS